MYTPPICIEVFNWADAPLHYLLLRATSIHLPASSEEKQPMITIKMLTEESTCFTKLPNKPLTALNDHWPPEACSNSSKSYGKQVIFIKMVVALAVPR